MGIVEVWEQQRLMYQQRYVKYLKKWNKTHNEDDRGHMLECSYVLINIFRLTANQVEELDQFDYIGLTQRDLEDNN